MNFTRTSSEPLTIDQVAKFAPSAMALAPHASRSHLYTYIPTVDVIRGMESAGFLPFAAKQSVTRDMARREFTKHMIRFRQVGQQLARGDVFAEIVLVNSHDGSSAYKLMGGLWRLMCANGMCVSESALASVTVMHKGDVIEGVVRGSLAIARQSENVIETVSRWTGLQLSPLEQRALAVSAHTLRFADAEGKTHTPITPDQLLQIRRHDDNGRDLWQTFNRVQENVIKGGLSARTQASYDEHGKRIPPRRVTTREVKGIDQDVKLNRALWQLAEEMARLKTGA
jgi:hypothetical protein